MEHDAEIEAVITSTLRSHGRSLSRWGQGRI